MFDGSLTPPLSDLSDYDDEDSNANCQNSPVLSRLQKPSTSKERPRKRKLSLNDSSPSKPTLGLREKEVKCICMASNLQLLSEEFYKASNYILYIENKVTDSLKLSDFKCTSNMKPLFNILNIFLEQFDGVKYKDEVCHLIEKLDVLCGEISLVASAGPRYLHRLLSSQFRLSVEEKCLHDCNSQDLIDWMHSFCEVNTYALNTACLARNKCKQLNVIEVLHTSGLPVLYDGDLVVRSVNRILHQLFCMVGQAYNYLKSRVSQNAVKAIMKYPPLPCDCFRDLINKCYSLVDEAEFWGMLAEIFQGCVQNIKVRKNGGTVSTHISEFEELPDVVSCFFWWIRNMTVFSSSTTHGLTTRLIRTSMSHHCDDVTLGLHILCYRDITKSCATELAAFYLLSHHFIKKLNCTFKKRHGIAQFTNNPLSAVEWLTVVRRLNTQSVTGDTMPKDSFHCFLSLLQAVVRLNQDTMWTSLKERLISTLDSAGMNKLDVTGLENFFSFVIAVVSSCPPCHIPDFMLEVMKLFNQCCIARSDYGKQITAVNGLFALMFQLAELKLTFSDLATKANKLFTQICRLLSNKSLKTDERNSMFQVFIAFLQSVAQLFMASATINLGQVLLITPDTLGSMLEQAKPSEIASVLYYVDEIYTSLRNATYFASECEQICHNLFMNIHNCMKQETVTCSNEKLDQLMRSMILVPLKINKDSPMCDKVKAIWVYFCSEEKIKAVRRCTFMIDTLSDASFEIVIHKEQSNLGKEKMTLTDAAIQGWLKCSVFSCHVGERLSALDSHIAKFPALKLVVGEKHPHLSFQIFVLALSENHKNSKNFLERIKWAEMASRWFGPVVDASIPALVSSDVKLASSVYFTMGSLIQHCCSMLYTPGKPCVVSKLFEHLISVGGASIQTNTNISTVLQNSLHKFILGGLGSNASYIKKCLKQIVALYINKWTFSNEKQTHPYLLILQDNSNTIQNYMLDLLLESMSSNNTEKLAMVVQILFAWCNNIDENQMAHYETAIKYLPLLQQARLQLRFNTILLEQTNYLLQTFRKLT